MLRFPWGAARFPVLTTVPPKRVKLSPELTAKLPKLTILPARGFSNLKALGVPTRFDQLLFPIASNQLLLPKPIPVAVVAVKEAGTFKLALLPKTMPAGLIKNK
jgi:hypothetical protein